MGKNILVLTGSPRAGGNSDRLAQAFVEGAQEAGHTVNVFAAGRANIGGCRACEACFTQGRPCVFEDDFGRLDSYLREAEVIALASPLYWYDFTAQLKAAIDRLSAYSGRGILRIKESVLLLCGAVEEREKFNGAMEVYRLITQGRLNWTDRGIVLAPGCGDKGAILRHPALEEARALGKSI